MFLYANGTHTTLKSHRDPLGEILVYFRELLQCAVATMKWASLKVASHWDTGLTEVQVTPIRRMFKERKSRVESGTEMGEEKKAKHSQYCHSRWQTFALPTLQTLSPSASIEATQEGQTPELGLFYGTVLPLHPEKLTPCQSQNLPTSISLQACCRKAEP